MTSLTFDPDLRHYHWAPVHSMEARIPRRYRYWIHLPGSLTQALRQRSGRFNVQVLDERRLTLNPPPGLLAPAGSRACWSRKVCLSAADTPWVAAHTVLLESSLEQGLAQLTQLNDRPLGELLFTTEGVTRDTLEVAETPHGWARRTRYWLQGHPLLVAEFFLDDLIHDEHRRLTALSETDPT